MSNSRNVEAMSERQKKRFAEKNFGNTEANKTDASKLLSAEPDESKVSVESDASKPAEAPRVLMS